MKKITFTSLFLLALGLITCCSCNKIKDLAKINFNLDNADGEFTIPVIPAGDASLGSAAVYLNLDSIISAQNSKLSASNVKEVHIKTCQLVLLNGDKDNNFSALESCSIKVNSNTKADYITMASVSDNPDQESYTLDMTVDQSVDLKDYFLNANVFTYQVAGKSRKATTKALQCQVKVTYTITAGL